MTIKIKKYFVEKKQICAKDHRIIPSDYYSEINIGEKYDDFIV